MTVVGKEKGDHMADVLLSLKHAVVHPHQVGETSPTAPPPTLTPPLSSSSLPSLHHPTAYSPTPYPTYSQMSSYMPLAPLSSLSPTGVIPESQSLGNFAFANGIVSPPPGDPGDTSLLANGLPTGPLDYPGGLHTAGGLASECMTGSPVSPSHPLPPFLPPPSAMSGGVLSMPSSTSTSLASFAGSFGSIGGPLPSMTSSIFSGGTNGSNLGGSLGSSFLPASTQTTQVSTYPYQSPPQVKSLTLISL